MNASAVSAHSIKQSILTLLIALCGALFTTAEPGDQNRSGVTDQTFIYTNAGGDKLRMEVFYPPDHQPEKASVPGMILFHGGGWVNGSLTQFRPACEYFASRGIVCATVEYRMHDKAAAARMPANESFKRICITDARSAIRWFKHNAGKLGIDPARVIVGGGSAGGHISALATLNPGLNDSANAREGDTSAAAYLWFNPGFDPKDAADPEVDLLRHLKADLPPTLVFFGDEDRVKLGWDIACDKSDKLRAAHIELQLAKGQGHGFFNKEPWRTAAFIAADEFLVRHGFLTGKPTLKLPATGEKLIPGPRGKL